MASGERDTPIDPSLRFADHIVQYVDRISLALVDAEQAEHLDPKEGLASDNYFPCSQCESKGPAYEAECREGKCRQDLAFILEGTPN